MTLKEKWEIAAAVAQVFATLLSGIAICVSLYLWRASLKELHADRSLRVRPLLMFNTGGQVVSCELRMLGGIPGIDPHIARKFLSGSPAGARGCYPTGLWGRLVNHGNGSALNTLVTFEAKRVTKAGEIFQIDESKLHTFPYAPPFNSVHAFPSHIKPGEEGKFFRIPTPLVTDFSAQISELLCTAIISYQDVFGESFETKQPVRFFAERESDPTATKMKVIVTFSSTGEEIEDE